MLLRPWCYVRALAAHSRYPNLRHPVILAYAALWSRNSARIAARREPFFVTWRLYVAPTRYTLCFADARVNRCSVP